LVILSSLFVFSVFKLFCFACVKPRLVLPVRRLLPQDEEGTPAAILAPAFRAGSLYPAGENLFDSHRNLCFAPEYHDWSP
jgi:hypothetical protein